MIRFREARKRDVVTTDDAETVGRIDRFVIDPGTHRISAVRLSKADGDRDFASWSDIESFGRDAVTVRGSDVLRVADGPRETELTKHYEVLGKRVLSDGGRELGQVEGVEFDPATGEVTALLTGSDQIAGERLRGIGSYAVVVRS